MIWSLSWLSGKSVKHREDNRECESVAVDGESGIIRFIWILGKRQVSG